MIFLVPIDLSDESQRIVDQAKALAESAKGTVILVHVAEPEPDFVGYDTGPDVVRDHVAHAMRQEHQDIQKFAEQLREQGVDATALLVQGPTVETILEEISKRNADMVVMGSHGHGAMHNLLLGSVSEGVVRHATCPVVLVPTRPTPVLPPE